MAQAAAAAANDPIRVALAATGMAAINVAAGSGTPTAIAWPAGAIRSAPYTKGSWSISGGNLRCDEPGLYRFTLTGVFDTGLALTGGFRFEVACAGDATQYASQVPLIGVLAPALGVAFSGVLLVPSGGANITLRSGHTALGATALTFAELKMSLVREAQ